MRVTHGKVSVSEDGPTVTFSGYVSCAVSLVKPLARESQPGSCCPHMLLPLPGGKHHPRPRNRYCPRAGQPPTGHPRPRKKYCPMAGQLPSWFEQKERLITNSNEDDDGNGDEDDSADDDNADADEDEDDDDDDGDDVDGDADEKEEEDADDEDDDDDEDGN